MLTLGNLLSGFASVFLASRPADTLLPMGWSPLTFAGIMIFAGMLFDGLDGSVARMTGATSILGEQLDSMADMVTFGVAPAFLAVQLIGQLIGLHTPYLAIHNDLIFDRVVLVIACIYVACTALRLARFNVEVHQPAEEDHMSFKGLPSPGAAGTVASLVLLHQHMVAVFHMKHVEMGSTWMPTSALLAAYAMVAIMMLAAFAMVSKLRYVHVTNRFLARQRARTGTLAKLIIVLLLLAIYPRESIAAAFCFYALSAPTMWVWQHTLGRKTAG
jgi:CDP-diacylglycerol--serine O-phosphatidyltransferase